MNLYVDDLRPFPAGYCGARTIQDAKKSLTVGKFDIVSLDYDMGMYTTMTLLEWMRQKQIWPTKGFILHTSSPYGREDMESFIKQYSPVPILEIKYYG